MFYLMQVILLKKDKEFQTVKTELKNYSNKIGLMIDVEIRIKDSTAIIIGHYNAVTWVSS